VTVAALPYVAIPRFGFVNSYATLLLLGLVLGALVMQRLGRRYGIAGGECVALAAVLAAVAFVTAHVFDVAVYQWARAMTEPALWFRFQEGHSLFGALLGVAIVLFAWTRIRGLDLALHADLVAVGTLVAVTLGRVGCALVHDHPGAPTELPIGVDFPTELVHFHGIESDAPTVRLHDLGLEEVVLLLPVLVMAKVLVARRLRAGMVAAIVAIAYACIRFPLDFLRLPMTEPVHRGLTAGQWSCIVMFVVAMVLAVWLSRVGHIAPLASELGGRPGGRRRTGLPPAIAR
jgi:phosphatidylglycerol:prolipoprotein diacylglycerol transferase